MWVERARWLTHLNHNCSCVYSQVYTTLLVCSTGVFANLQLDEATRLFLLLQEGKMKVNSVLGLRLVCVPFAFALIKYSS